MGIDVLCIYRIFSIKRSDIMIKRGKLYYRYYYIILLFLLIILINFNYLWYMKLYVVFWELINLIRKIIVI